MMRENAARTSRLAGRSQPNLKHKKMALRLLLCIGFAVVQGTTGGRQ